MINKQDLKLLGEWSPVKYGDFPPAMRITIWETKDGDILIQERSQDAAIILSKEALHSIVRQVEERTGIEYAS